MVRQYYPSVGHKAHRQVTIPFQNMGAFMKFPKYRTLQVSKQKSNLFITLNRPEQRNAMNVQMVDEIINVFDDVRDSKDIRAIVFRGAEGNFCSGEDTGDLISARQTSLDGDSDPYYKLNRKLGRMLMKINNSSQVVVTVLEGAVLGGGFGIACVSDVAIAKRDAQFGMPETTMGIPPAQVIPFVVQRIGLTHARRLALLGARFNAETAFKLGIVHVVCGTDEKLEMELKTTLVQVKLCAPGANAVTKEIMLSVGKMPFERLLNQAAREYSTCLQGPEGKEGSIALKEKRLPFWAITDKYVIIQEDRPKVQD